MALVKTKPTSPGRRSMVKVVNADLHKGEPVASLVESQKRGSGRNNLGHITTRHKGGGHKHHYRVVDFLRNKDGITCKVERVEYDAGAGRWFWEPRGAPSVETMPTVLTQG